MFFKKKKKQKSALIYTLEQELTEAKRLGKPCFYYPLEEHEIDRATAWCVSNKIGIVTDHITDGVTYYKFFSYRMED